MNQKLFKQILDRKIDTESVNYSFHIFVAITSL